MAKNKYAKDYQLLETVDQKGRIHTDYEYIGRPYRFDQSAGEVRRELLLRLGLCVLGFVSWVAAMLPNSQAMRTLWVSLPFVFAAVPLGLLTGTVFSLLRAGDPMEHRFADKLENRYPPAALAVCVLSAAAALGAVAGILTGRGSGAGEWLFTVCALVTALCGGLCFFRRGRLTASER